MKSFRSILLSFLPALMLIGVAGCGSTPKNPAPDPDKPVLSDLLRVGDMLVITFSGPTQPPPEHSERLSKDGFIRLPNIEKVKAVGRTRVEVQEEIRTKYVPNIFVALTVTIAPAERFFYVDGEVNDKNRHPYLGELTVLDAIAAAGGFTDFANRKKVQLTRSDNSIEFVNCDEALKNPVLNPKVFPGDKIFVKRSWFN